MTDKITRKVWRTILFLCFLGVCQLLSSSTSIIQTFTPLQVSFGTDPRNLDPHNLSKTKRPLIYVGEDVKDYVPKHKYKAISFLGNDLFDESWIYGNDESQIPPRGQEQAIVVAPIRYAADQPGHELQTNQTEGQCFYDTTLNKQQTSKLSKKKHPEQKTLVQFGVYNSYRPQSFSSDFKATLQYNTQGLIKGLDENIALFHYDPALFDNSGYLEQNEFDNSVYLVQDEFNVCARGNHHAGVYLVLNTGKVGRMMLMCSGAMRRYTGMNVIVLFDLDRCDKSCVKMIQDHMKNMRAFLSKQQTFDIKTVTVDNLLESDNAQGATGITPFLPIFMQHFSEGGDKKYGSSRGTAVDFVESAVQESGVIANIKMNAAVHEGFHYKAMGLAMSSYHSNAIEFWDDDLSIVLSENGLLDHPLVEMEVIVLPFLCSWEPARPNITEVELTDIKRTLNEILSNNSDSGDKISQIEETFDIRVDSLPDDNDAILELVKNKMNEKTKNQSTQPVVAATLVAYDVVLGEDGTFAKNHVIDVIDTSGCDWGYDTSKMTDGQRECGRDLTRQKLKEAQETHCTKKSGDHCLVLIGVDRNVEGFKQSDGLKWQSCWGNLTMCM